MPDSAIFMLTGEIHSGKTTAIINWLAGRRNVFGILTPVIKGTRFFVDANTRDQFEMEASKEETEILKIGKFKFSSTSFKKASDILKRDMNSCEGWLVIDEIGPLELQQKGFYGVMKEILAKNNTELKKLLVVRQFLVEEVVSFFGITDYKVITSLNEL